MTPSDRFHDGSPLRPGDHFRTPSLMVDEDMRRDVVRLGGYTHPLFTAPDQVRLPSGSPLPGQAVLMLMGGLVEQTKRVDDAVALIGMTDVRFLAPAVPGTQLHVEVSVIAHTPRTGGRAVREMRWAAQDADGTTLVEATVCMLIWLKKDRPCPQN